MAKPIDELVSTRIEKLKKLRSLGIEPYPSKFEKTNTVFECRELLEKQVKTAGRIMSLRAHGAITFGNLTDESGKIQILFREDKLGKEKYEILPLLDIGDFLGIEGTVIKSKTGETTVDVDKFELLSKSIRPMPNEWYGIKDEETRYRQRYLDLILNEDLKHLFRKKANFWNSMRRFLIEKGFLEVETPVLEVTAGGADATPFTTHHNHLDIDLYLRISMGELWQKRLMVAGFEKTFEIGRQFRNEGISREHLQDYTQMEFYWAYANYEDSMKLVEEMYKYVAYETFGRLDFEINGYKIDLSGDWKKIDYTNTIREATGVDISSIGEEELKNKLRELKAEFKDEDGKGRLIDTLWKTVRRNIAGPVFLTGHPVEVSPLAKRMTNKPDFVERYQVIMAGSEMGNGYSELNDPIDQAQRFRKQQMMREKGDSEAQMDDHDFVTALEYGMPPVSGFGVSERLFSFLANLPIREAVLFPLMRPEK